MPRDWEHTLRNWASPPGQSERDRCAHAESMVRDAVNASGRLRVHDLEVFLQGSYRNNTNVCADSDVDVCVRCMDVFWVSHPFDVGIADADMGVVDDTTGYTYPMFKADVEAALRDHFGSSAVLRGDKALNVAENTYRVTADVVPCFEHRRYERFSDGSIYYSSGTAFRTDSGSRIENWPYHHYENGVEKNRRTGKRFKGMVRALKSLHNEMALNVGEKMPSFLLESLVWNVPDDRFGSSSYVHDLRVILELLIDKSEGDHQCSDWTEVNDLKYLFRGPKPWSRSAANVFLKQAWYYLRIGGAF